MNLECVQAKRFELNAVSVATIRLGAKALPPSISGAESNRCGHATQSAEAGNAV
jgi:hypothetical protein